MSLLLAAGGGGGPTNYADTLSVGAYALSGQSISDLYARNDNLAVGAYVISGKTVVDVYAHNDALSVGAYSISGQSVTDSVVRGDALSAENYSISGQSITDVRARSDSLAAGSYVISGQDITDVKVGGAVAYADTLSVGSYAVTGQDVTDLLARSDDLSAGSYVLTGTDITDVKTGGVVIPLIPEPTVPAGMTFTPVRVGQVQVAAKILEISYGKVSASGEIGSQAAIAYVLPAGKTPVRHGAAKTGAGATARTCGRVVWAAKGKAVGTAGGKAVASSARVGVKAGEITSTAGGWVRIQGVFLRTAGGPGQATGIRNLTDMEVLMLYRQVRRTRGVAQTRKV